MRHAGHRYAVSIRVCKYGAPILASSTTCATGMFWASPVPRKVNSFPQILVRIWQDIHMPGMLV